MRYLLALAATVLVASLWAPSAQAQDGGAPDAWQRKALTLAQRVWHPTCGTLSIQWAAPADFGGTPEWGGWAYLGECTIYEPAAHYWLGYPEFCTDVLHEGGHAAGHEHSDRGIMEAQRTIGLSHNTRDGHALTPKWTGVDRRCMPTRK
jgi:hypothetical protein